MFELFGRKREIERFENASKKLINLTNFSRQESHRIRESLISSYPKLAEIDTEDWDFFCGTAIMCAAVRNVKNYLGEKVGEQITKAFMSGLESNANDPNSVLLQCATDLMDTWTNTFQKEKRNLRTLNDESDLLAEVFGVWILSACANQRGREQQGLSNDSSANVRACGAIGKKVVECSETYFSVPL
ncbi:MAG: hypothetical protein HY423_07860 [Candidatus Lambdaproteobacteria bacterium]|nr:hypothetical protein [Candidatus Lambdaproteobacteria bacterium]